MAQVELQSSKTDEYLFLRNIRCHYKIKNKFIPIIIIACWLD